MLPKTLDLCLISVVSIFYGFKADSQDLGIIRATTFKITGSPFNYSYQTILDHTPPR
jgi:hypothetical protein